MLYRCITLSNCLSINGKKLNNPFFSNSFLLYVIGVIWLLALPLNDYNDGCYISENALMPGMTHTHYSQFRDAKDIAEDLRKLSSR